MIDTSSSIDILYFKVFQKLVLSTNNLTPITSSLMKFTNNSISPFGTMSLHIMFRDEPCSKMVISKFIVINILSTYNATIGETTLNILRAMVLSYHIMMKFLIITSIRELRSNLRESPYQRRLNLRDR